MAGRLPSDSGNHDCLSEKTVSTRVLYTSCCKVQAFGEVLRSLGVRGMGVYSVFSGGVLEASGV